jgi:hypothetical protein
MIRHVSSILRWLGNGDTMTGAPALGNHGRRTITLRERIVSTRSRRRAGGGIFGDDRW